MVILSEFAKLPEKISDPIAIIADKDTNDILILVGMKNLFGKRIVVPFQIEGGIRFGGESLDVQRAKSVYGRSDAIDKLLTAIEEDSDENIQLFYLNKDKSQKVVSAADKYIGDTVPNGIVHRLTEKNSPVKIQIHNQTELNQFRRWFKNSKVVNDDGTPKIVYHGTSEDFTVFDRTKGRANMDIQGMFFSPRAEEAADYGDKVGRYYLSIRNPASQYAAIKALNRFKGQNNAGVKAREYLESLGYDGVAWDSINKGQQKQLYKKDEIRAILDRFGVEVNS